MAEVINIKKRTLFLALSILIGLAAIALIFYNLNPIKNSPTQTANLEGKSLEARFEYLKEANTNLCAGVSFIDAKSDTDRLQGSCCSAMDFHRYEEQVEGLANLKDEYSYIGDDLRLIPDDPYDIEVSLAKELLEYQKTIQLTAEQQAVYDEATDMSMEGGPCCCVCWRWYAFEGQTKYLITEHGFNSEQIAELWDIEDGCGGSGHVEGVLGH